MTLISIGMSVRNGAATLPLALHSLAQQTYANWELILIDDGSTDDTVSIARAFGDPRIRMVSHAESRGLATRLNEAIDLARGELFARMDADDVAYPERLEKQLAYLQPGLDLIACRVLVFDAAGRAIGTIHANERHEDIVRAPWRGFIDLMHPTWLGRIEWFRRWRYDERYRLTQDREILYRAWRTSRFATVPEILLGYRQDDLHLRKFVRSRGYTMRACLEGAFKRGDWPLLVGVPTQAAKLAIDAIAIGTGLRYRLLRHRARPIDRREIERWERVWAGVSRARSAT